jgi:hypothetical protein
MHLEGLTTRAMRKITVKMAGRSGHLHLAEADHTGDYYWIRYRFFWSGAYEGELTLTHRPDVEYGFTVSFYNRRKL